MLVINECLAEKLIVLVIKECLALELIMPVIKKFSFEVDHAFLELITLVINKCLALELIMLVRKKKGSFGIHHAVIKEVFTFGVDHTCDKGSATLELIMLVIEEFSYGVNQLMIKTCSFRVDHARDQGVFSESIMLVIK
ncbi:hypothetical protein TIFTF001_055701 [Ficus carica]|uniref:Uncharacterized protein n=1 Tax=Ficus carica TaxID=3494 RepID=A0AA88JGG6_FICCA|nr:hypothetical protein TIFTF001_055700 [Ficus carica]GMN73205.1 hypothetical protein TIFTF001_055701 [Ficus carica]